MKVIARGYRRFMGWRRVFDNDVGRMFVYNNEGVAIDFVTRKINLGGSYWMQVQIKKNEISKMFFMMHKGTSLNDMVHLLSEAQLMSEVESSG